MMLHPATARLAEKNMTAYEITTRAARRQAAPAARRAPLAAAGTGPPALAHLAWCPRCGTPCEPVVPGADSPVPFTLTPRAHDALERGSFPPVVCLCGSTRFAAEFNRQRKELTEHGQIVLSIEIVTTPAREHDPQHADPALKARLDELHKRKIDLADYVLVLNVGGYIGESTRSEIAYARAHGKPVRYLEPPADAAPGPVMDCGCGYVDCSACAGYGWACQRCELAFAGSPPEHGLCRACQASAGDR